MNNKQSTEKKQIIEDVKIRIDRGEPKQQILEELSQLYKDRVTIVKQLEVSPSKVMRYKYRMHNYLLAALLLAALVLDIISLSRLEWGDRIVDVNSALNVVLDVIFLIGVLSYRIEIYSWIAARAVVTLITIMAAYTYYHRPVEILIFISLALIVISFVLGLLLGVKLCPPRVPKTVEVDIDGTEKINKTIYVFPD
ncbi:MAG: hypothetical protein LBL24_07625 [Bacteroidales bacterium]|nr:hypothetical protein [Bacteroidales bacterium]